MRTELYHGHEITSVRTIFDVSVSAQPQADGTMVCLVVPRHRESWELHCESFEIDSTLRPVFKFSARVPEPKIGSLMAYVPPQSFKRDRGFACRISPTGYDGDYTETRIDGEEVAWLRSELWSEMDSSAVAEYGKYCVSSGVLNIYTDEHAVSGLGCCGYDIDVNGDIVQPYDGAVIAAKGADHYPRVLAECALSDSGFNAGGEHEDSGNNHAKLVRAAKRAVAR